MLSFCNIFVVMCTKQLLAVFDLIFFFTWQPSEILLKHKRNFAAWLCLAGRLMLDLFVGLHFIGWRCWKFLASELLGHSVGIAVTSLPQHMRARSAVPVTCLLPCFTLCSIVELTNLHVHSPDGATQCDAHH